MRFFLNLAHFLDQERVHIIIKALFNFSARGPNTIKIWLRKSVVMCLAVVWFILSVSWWLSMFECSFVIPCGRNAQDSLTPELSKGISNSPNFHKISFHNDGERPDGIWYLRAIICWFVSSLKHLISSKSVGKFEQNTEWLRQYPHILCMVEN